MNIDLTNLNAMFGPGEIALPDSPRIATLRETLALDRCRERPFAHQVIGVEQLYKHPYYFLADEMGAGKTKQVIDTVHLLYQQNLVDRVIVDCPASVRPVWFHEEMGELAKHLWHDVPSQVIEYHTKFETWDWGTVHKSQRAPLQWFVTNFDFLRQDSYIEHVGRRKVYRFPVVDELKQYCTPKTLLIIDESSAVANHKALQSRATLQLRNACGRVWLLNGTPIPNDPLDLYSQGRIMSPAIWECTDFYEFRGRYAVITTERGFNQIVKWINLEDLQRRMTPYIIRRLKKDCLDLPEKLPAKNIPITLKPKTWNALKEMRDELCVWLGANTVSTAPHAATKVLRLAQITSGFLGGVEQAISDVELEADYPEFNWDDPPPPLDLHGGERGGKSLRLDLVTTQEIGREKLDYVLQWFRDHLEIDRNLKLLVWCRFRAELERLTIEAEKLHKKIQVGKIYGAQKREEREHALRLLDPRFTPSCPVLVAGTPQTGRTGLNLTAAHHVIYMSHDFSLFTRLQSEDRSHRPGQLCDVNYYNLVAVGPKGQKTVDHLMLDALEKKANVANWVASAWIQKLQEE